jgi:hypothetical protein
MGTVGRTPEEAADLAARPADQIRAYELLLAYGWGKAAAFVPIEGAHPLERGEPRYGQRFFMGAGPLIAAAGIKREPLARSRPKGRARTTADGRELEITSSAWWRIWPCRGS